MKRFSLVVNRTKDIDGSLSRQVLNVLTASADFVCTSDPALADGKKIKFVSEEKLFDGVDAVICVGGDGTILQIAPVLAQKQIPVLGINRGRMGFLAELEPGEINLLQALYSDSFQVEKRMMLDAEIVKNGKIADTFTVLNDVTVNNGSVSRMVDLSLTCNGRAVSRFYADGLILSTPTGSTAYSLSAGGSVIDPALSCILMTPVCAHSFYNARPMVFSGESVLEIAEMKEASANTYVTPDGRCSYPLSYGDRMIVKKSSLTVDLIKIKSQHFYDIVYNKLSERDEI